VALDLLLEQGALAAVVVCEPPAQLGHARSIANVRSAYRELAIAA
jgi:hypothetical protein